MRIDVFLRNSGLVPRRTLAQKMCDGGLVKLDGRTAKAASPVEVGQEISLQMGMSRRRYRVLLLPDQPVAKRNRQLCAERLEDAPEELSGKVQDATGHT